MMRIYRKDELGQETVLSREQEKTHVEQAVTEILDRVRAEGDRAVLDYTERFDGVRPEPLEVSAAEKEEALSLVEPEFLDILREAAANIRHFHSQQKRSGFILNDRPGIVMGQKVTPLERAGIYVPGGTAAYPSTVLMDTIPAKIAGVGEIVMVTPPGKNGKIAPVILAAAGIAGADRIFKCGGAQAVGALAYGTESIPRVDKIVGPGNAFVAEAKRQVFGQVAIDMIAGPSEILIVADGKTNPRWAAADLLSQAEHDKMASAVLITDSPELAKAVQQEVERQLAVLPREAIARVSVDSRGKIILTESIEEAIALSNSLAPEHLELCLDNPFDVLDQVKHAGSVFLGRSCPEALGDYFAGPNHTLPTGGTARFSSPLSVDDFVKKTQYSYFTPQALARDADKIACFAEREGLSGHARSALSRKES